MFFQLRDFIFAINMGRGQYCGDVIEVKSGHADSWGGRDVRELVARLIEQISGMQLVSY